MNNTEVWVPVVGFEELYSVSNYGGVRSEDNIIVSKNGVKKRHKGRLLRIRKNRTGYGIVFLSANGRPKPYQVHRLVADAFIENPNSFPCVNHKNGIRDDNRVENLEWCTYSYNNSYPYKALNKKGTWHNCFESKNPNAKPCIQVFPNGNTIEYSCAIRASKETNVPVKNICATCRGEQKTAGGFGWRWK